MTIIIAHSKPVMGNMEAWVIIIFVTVCDLYFVWMKDHLVAFIINTVHEEGDQSNVN